MQDGGYEGAFWADHHEQFSNDLHTLFTNLAHGFKRLTARQFDAPWRTNDKGASQNCPPDAEASCSA